MDALKTFKEHPTWSWYAGKCLYCKQDNDPYMVRFELWETLIPKKHQRSLICIACFEQLLGRQITLADLLVSKIQPDGVVPINRGITQFLMEQTER